MIRWLPVLLVFAVSSADAAPEFCESPTHCGASGVCINGLCRHGNDRALVEHLYTLAIPRPIVVGSSPWLKAEASRVHQQVLRDLRWTGFYDALPEKGMPFSWRIEGVSPSETRRLLWQRTGAYRILRLLLRPTGHGRAYMLQARLVDIERFALAKFHVRRIVRPGMSRRTAAHLVNQLVDFDTGLPGVAGTRLATSVRVGPGRKEIGVLDVDGGLFRLVTATRGLNLDPAWSPGGALGYMSYRGHLAAWMVEGRVLSGRPGMNASGAWSPDGRWVALSITEGANSDIVVLDARTGREKLRVTQHPRADTSPTWSPDGQRLAFVSDRRGLPQIWTVALRTGAVKALTKSGYNTSPAWSPTGFSILYTRFRGAKFVIMRHDLDTGAVQPLTSAGVSSESPSFSTYGRYVAFSRKETRSSPPQLWIMNANGGRARPLPTVSLPMYAPAWHRRRATTRTKR